MNGYHTVTEYARLTGKDPGNIRRLLIAGRLIGEKVGRQWLIKEGTDYPQDERIRSGRYQGFRKKLRFNSENQHLSEGVKKLTASICEVYGKHIDAVILYGSYARGTQTSESDVDLAMILKPGHTEEMHKKITDIIVDLELEYGVVFSTVPIDTADYANRRGISPFYKNINKEGIVLWKATVTNTVE